MARPYRDPHMRDMTRNFAWMPVMAVLLWGTAARGQTAVPPAPFETTFPEGVDTPTADQLQARLRDQVFTGAVSTGIGWRMDFKASGHIFSNLSNGARDSGTWRAEDGRLCITYRGPFPSSCADIRTSPDTVYYKRAINGEIVKLRAQ